MTISQPKKTLSILSLIPIPKRVHKHYVKMWAVRNFLFTSLLYIFQRDLKIGLYFISTSLQISGASAIQERAHETRERARSRFHASRFARALVYRAGLANPPVLQANQYRHFFHNCVLGVTKFFLGNFYVMGYNLKNVRNGNSFNGCLGWTGLANFLRTPSTPPRGGW